MTCDCNAWISLLGLQTFQIAAVALVALLVARSVGKNRPHLAHAMWAVVILKCLTPPIVALPTSSFCWLSWDSNDNRATETNLHQAVLPSVIVDLADQTTSVTSNGETPTIDSTAVSWMAVSDSPSDHVAQESVTRRANWQQWLLVIWVVGVFTATIWLGLKLCRFLYLIRQKTLVENDSRVAKTAQMIEEVGLKLKLTTRLRKRIRIRIVDANIGPAVIGIVRPTVLLPKCIVDSVSEQQLRLLVAHELIHLKRRDLNWAALQTVASVIWWFNPLVLLASRRLSLEAERSCDEETLASLKCDPASYARCLIEILEMKHRLEVVPALPGVRPVEITAKRMERIMRLGNKGLSKQPWWYFVLLCIASLVALPGARWAAGQTKQLPKQSQNKILDPAATLPLLLPAVVLNNTQLPGTAEEQKRQYDVKKLLERIQSDEKVSSSQAAKELITLVSGAASVASNFIASPSLIEVVGGEKLVAMATDQQHQRIQAELIRLEKFGLTQLLIETRMICIPADQLKEIVLDWQVDIDRSADKPEPNSAVITASAIVKKPRLPVLVAEVTAKQLASVLTKLQSNRHTNIMAAPKLTLFNGMSATISDATLRPFVVGMTQVAPGEKQQPVISIMPDGMSIEFRPELVDQRITLNVEVGLSEIREVKELTYRTTAQPDNAGTTLQVPNVNAFSFQCGTQPIKQGNTLVVATRRLNSSKNEVLMLTLTTSKIDQNSEMDSGALQAAVANRQAAVGAQSKILDLGAKSVETSTSIHGPTLKVGETKVTQPSMDDVIQLLEKSGNHTELLTEIEQRQPKVEMSLKQLSKNTPPARFVPTLGHAQLIRVQYEATLKTSDGQTLGQPIQVEYIQYQLTDPPQPSAGQEVDTFYWENGSPRTAKEPLLPAPVASPRVRK